MNLFDELTPRNFELFAANQYRNNRCLNVEDFYDDIDRFRRILKLLRKYRDKGILRERLIMNHLVIIHNQFNISGACRMLQYKLEKDLLPILKPFLLYLNVLPEDQLLNIDIDINVTKRIQAI